MSMSTTMTVGLLRPVRFHHHVWIQCNIHYNRESQRREKRKGSSGVWRGVGLVMRRGRVSNGCQWAWPDRPPQENHRASLHCGFTSRSLVSLGGVTSQHTSLWSKKEAMGVDHGEEQHLQKRNKQKRKRKIHWS